MQNYKKSLKVDVYNINYEENSELLQKSKHLTDYSLFTYHVNEGRATGKSLEEAIKDAIRYCIEHDIMSEFLRENSSEVHNMLLGEWKLDEAMEYKEQKGKIEERERMIRALKGVLAPEVIAEKFQLSLDYVLRVLNGESVIAESGVPYNAEKKE